MGSKRTTIFTMCVCPFCLQRMSKDEHLSLLVSVVGLSGCGAEVYKGPGKSSLCFNLLHPTEYLKEHPSVLSLQQFESKVINSQHFVYWGSKIEYYYKLPKSKKATEKILVTVNFEIFEHTEFIEDVTKKPFPYKQEYADRALKLPHASNKLSFKTIPLVFTPEKYQAAVSPSTKGLKVGYIFAIDVSKDCPTFPHQLRLLKKMVKSHKKQFVIAATKFDQVESTYFEEVKIAGRELNVEVIPTSIEMEDGRWGTEAFKYLAIKIFNLQTEDTTGVAGDSYLRYATEPPPTSAPTKKLEHMGKSVEERSRTPPIPPRNYDSGTQSLPASCINHNYGNFAQQSTEKTSVGDATARESRFTEIPAKIKARKPHPLDLRPPAALPTIKSNPVPVESSEAACSTPPLPPKPRSNSLKPSRALAVSPNPLPVSPNPLPISPNLLPVSPNLLPASSSPKQSVRAKAMSARPLPKLPFVGENDSSTNVCSMRCDYDKVDYAKMRRYRDMPRNSAQKSKLQTKVSTANVTIPARNIPRHKDEPPTSSEEVNKRKPPPVAKKPSVRPRKPSLAAKSGSTEQNASAATNEQRSAPSLERYEDTVIPRQQACDYDDTTYVNEGEDKQIAPNSGRPKYPPRCIPRKYYFLNAPRALPT